MSFTPVSAVKMYSTTWWKAEAVGDHTSGVFVDKAVVANNYDPERPYNETQYRLVQTDGSHVIVKGRYGDPKQLPDLETVPFGSLVEVTYVGDKQGKKKGYRPYKVFSVGVDKEAGINQAVLDEYTKGGEPVSAASTSVDSIPF